MIITLSPYLPGKGPTLDIDLLERTLTSRSEEASRLVFTWGEHDYRPGLGITTDLDEAQDIVLFAQAYAERRREFDRSPKDAEQLARDWWAEHGDVMSSELDSLIADTTTKRTTR